MSRLHVIIFIIAVFITAGCDAEKKIDDRNGKAGIDRVRDCHNEPEEDNDDIHAAKSL